ncbi:MAG: aspartate/glutamate racemase family protein [Antarcticimicrobium sp.]|uniref:arylmalonate decarboxylase n=1 Tax=Antarcticimicrobium sp. TaxID=2824147 RepID=UPI0026033FE9|nr:aspartate/glutamate racemase family protein [Antarcticimicrobium sp.]MDF1715408.1 aspartate/glutamate racemase family protein [Antarcticimicrobium sp.]
MTCIGMIVPPAAGAVPPEPPQLYPDIDFLSVGLGIPEVTPEGFNQVIGRLSDLAGELRAQGAEAISLMGTSLSFYRGPEGNAEVLEALRAGGGVPATTMTDSVLEALAAVGARRVAVGTAYTEPVNAALTRYLTASGYEVTALEAMHLQTVEEVFATSDADLIALGHRAVSAAPGADCLFISCGGLHTLPVIPALEAAHGLPVISSATAGAWGAARLAGHSGRSPGHGRLFGI